MKTQTTRPKLPPLMQRVKVRHVWRGTFIAQWRDNLNGRRWLEALFRKIDGKWQSGGTHTEQLREALPRVAEKLEALSNSL